MARGARQDSRAITVFIDGVNTGLWDKKSGGGRTSDNTKYPPGGMQEEIDLGGRATSEDITLSRYFDLDRDLPRIKRWLNRVGKATVKVVEQYLDQDGAAYGNPVTRTGTLNACTDPEADSESTDAALVEIGVSVAGPVG